MTLSALQQAVAGHTTIHKTREYRGVEVVSRFAAPQAEWTALRTGCAVVDLGFRTQVRVTGEDRTRWLNGLTTNNIRDLAPGRGIYAFLLNPQGRILGDMYAYNRGDSITVDTDRSQVEKILATFDHYIIMDDVESKNLSEELTALGVSGPKAQEILRAAGIDTPALPPLQTHDITWQGSPCTLVRGEDEQRDSFEIWLAPKTVRPAWDALLAAGATPVGSEAQEIDRIVSGIPLYGVDIRERDLPQETEQLRALSFNKGCYVGQEIVERIRSRGNVHRKFTGFIAEDGAQIVPGSKVLVGEKEVGEITSMASLETLEGNKTLALGYIRREVGVPGREVTIGASAAIVTQIPFQVPTASSEPALAHQ